jgi:hypothetical protein
LDTHIVPLLSALYLLAFLDRSNIGYTESNLTLEVIANVEYQKRPYRRDGR